MFMKNEQVPNTKLNKSSFKFLVLFTFILGTTLLAFATWMSFKLFHPGDKLNQGGVDALIDEIRTYNQMIQFLSGWMIIISIVVWMHSKRSKSE
jgi:hypothetical protein